MNDQLSITSAAAVTNLDPASGLRSYLHSISKFPLLSLEREQYLAKRLRDENDSNAAHELVTSHLRLVPSIARKFSGYGLPTADIIAEGNIGLMQAVRRFDPERGFRLATYATWWIRASIQEYILAAVSIVKLGSSAVQKRLFFGLRRAKQKINAYGQYLSGKQVKQLADQFSVNESAIDAMNGVVTAGDKSLNVSVGIDEGSALELIDTIADERENPEIGVMRNDESNHRTSLLTEAMNSLTERERDIVVARRLNEPASTLEELSQKYGISRERVRQIENRSIEKIKANIAYE